MKNPRKTRHMPTEERAMTHQTTIPWARRLGALAVMIALLTVVMTVTVQADDPDWKQWHRPD